MLLDFCNNFSFGILHQLHDFILVAIDVFSVSHKIVSNLISETGVFSQSLRLELSHESPDLGGVVSCLDTFDLSVHVLKILNSGLSKVNNIASHKCKIILGHLDIFSEVLKSLCLRSKLILEACDYMHLATKCLFNFLGVLKLHRDLFGPPDIVFHCFKARECELRAKFEPMLKFKNFIRLTMFLCQ